MRISELRLTIFCLCFYGRDFSTGVLPWLQAIHPDFVNIFSKESELLNVIFMTDTAPIITKLGKC